MVESVDLAIEFIVFQEGAESFASGVKLDTTWGGLVDDIEEDGFLLKQPDKIKVPLLLPASLKADATSKEKGNIDQVFFGALDFDKIDDDLLEHLFEKLEDYSHVLYSTWSHLESMKEGGRPKLRLLIPFTRPVNPEEWSFFWPQLNTLFGGCADVKCADVSHGYFLPSAPPGTDKEDENLLLAVQREGEAVDVDLLLSVFDDELLSLSEEAIGRIELGPDRPGVSKKRIKKLFERKQRASNNYIVEMGEMLERVNNGEAIADVGGRDDAIYKLAGDLAKEYPDNDAQSLADMFKETLSVMEEINSNPSNPCPTVEDVFNKIERAQKRILAQGMAKERRDILRSKAAGIPSEYTPDYIQRFIDSTGHPSTPESFEDRYIIQSGSSDYYIFYGGYYYHRVTSSVEVSACKMLAPLAATDSDIQLETATGSARGIKDYMKACGSVCDNHTLSISQQVTHLQRNTPQVGKSETTFIEAVAPRRVLEEKYCPAVERWIDALCEKKLGDKLRDWMAVVPDPSKALAALALVGASGVGKTSFAHGMAKIWSQRGAVNMSNIISNFNAGITRCPLLLADEILPSINGVVPTEKIRSIISAGEHEINAKHKNIQYLEGFYRNVISVNSMDKLVFGGRGGTASGDDVLAISHRLLIIPVEKEASELFDFDLFVDSEALAKHSLWLWKNREVAPSRFGVETDSYKYLVASDNVASSLLMWLLDHLSDENRQLEEDKRFPVFVAKGELYVNISSIRDCWDKIADKNDRRPELKELKTALSVITEATKKPLQIKSFGSHKHYKKIKKEHLLAASEDPDFIELQLLIHTESVEDSYVTVPKRLRPTDEDKARRAVAVDALEALKDS